VVGDARSYIANSHEQFDIVLASLIDTWAASSAGAFALTENLLYTTDAFRDYYAHLSADGILSISRWHPFETRACSPPRSPPGSRRGPRIRAHTRC
jgi:spermidine synthase